MFEITRDFALAKDENDPLKNYRSRFHFPRKQGRTVTYFCGHSLGLQPKEAKSFIDIELQRWQDLAVEGHFQGQNAWLSFHKKSKPALSRLVGANEKEVVAMNSLTTNLHLMLASFYRPSGQRRKILIEAGAFPSDHFALTTFMELMGVNAAEDLVEIHPGENGHLPIASITSKIRELGGQLSLVFFPALQYYTGQYFPAEHITQAAHEVGAYAGFDLAHAIGNIPLSLHEDEVDFAVWCSYKYLNSGPGNTSGVYVHQKHAENVSFPRLGGWWGQNEQTRFAMENHFDPIPDVDGWQLSNVNILSTAAHLASLDIFEEAGIDNLREKSLELTGYLEYLLLSSDLITNEVNILTPSNPEERGCQLSLYLKNRGKEIFDYLMEEGVVMDWRHPNVIRVAPVPLYNTFEEVFDFVKLLERAFTTIDERK